MRLIDRFLSRAGNNGYWEGVASTASVLTTTYGAPGNESVLPQLVANAQDAYAGNAIVFGAILARISLFSEARFKFQAESDGSLTDLPPRAEILEDPWPNGTTGELLARMIQDVDLAGNAYLWRTGDQLVRLRPDQVTIVSQEETDASGRKYREVVGYYWDPEPIGTGKTSDKAQYYTVDEVAHWSPIPDPCALFKGMSWMTPVVREIASDNSLTEYKIQYLSNAATPNLMLKYKQKLLPETIDSLRERMQARHGGVANAFKTLILDQGADFTVVGNSLEQMNFTTVQAAGENRILIASGVPGIVVGSKEGLMAATYSNYAQAMRRFADVTMRPLWRSACACLESVVKPPQGQRLWYDTAGIAALQEGEKERAETALLQAQAYAQLVQFGMERKSARDAVAAGDVTLAQPTTDNVNITSFIPKAMPQREHIASQNGAPQEQAVPQ